MALAEFLADAGDDFGVIDGVGDVVVLRGSIGRRVCGVRRSGTRQVRRAKCVRILSMPSPVPEAPILSDTNAAPGIDDQVAGTPRRPDRGATAAGTESPP